MHWYVRALLERLPKQAAVGASICRSQLRGLAEVPVAAKFQAKVKKRLLGWCGSSSRCLCSIFRSRRKKISDPISTSFLWDHLLLNALLRGRRLVVLGWSSKNSLLKSLGHSWCANHWWSMNLRKNVYWNLLTIPIRILLQLAKKYVQFLNVRNWPNGISTFIIL